MDGDKTVKFKRIDIEEVLLSKYTNMNKMKIRIALIRDCVNLTRRSYYKKDKNDYYYYENFGFYRLYDAEKDGKWDQLGLLKRENLFLYI